MSAPPGFDAGASMLPDNPNAQIHVMRGGGSSFTPEQTKILSLYGLESGGIISDEIDEQTKVAFLQQLESGACNTDSGDSAILKKDCWAVVSVIRALIQYDIKKSLEKSGKTSLSTNTQSNNPESPVIAPSIVSNSEPSSPIVSESSVAPFTPESSVAPFTPESPVASVSESTNIEIVNSSKTNKRLSLNTSKRNKPFYSTVPIKNSNVSARIYGSKARNITNKYKNLQKTRKNQFNKNYKKYYNSLKNVKMQQGKNSAAKSFARGNQTKRNKNAINRSKSKKGGNKHRTTRRNRKY